MKFRAWDKQDSCMVYDGIVIKNGNPYQNFSGYEEYFDTSQDCYVENIVTELLEIDGELMQYTGLKDNKLEEIYEYDIIDEIGNIIENLYENEEIPKGGSHLVIEAMGTEAWESSYKEAIRRGCRYTQRNAL